MRAVYKQPGMPAEVINVENTLEALQEKVGGYIETVTFTTDTCVICNEEGRLMGLPYNLNFLGLDLVGPVLWVGVKGDLLPLGDEGAVAGVNAGSDSWSQEFTDVGECVVNYVAARWGG